MEKSAEVLRHSQAKCSELERTNKKLYGQTHADRKEIIKLKEVCGGVMSQQRPTVHNYCTRAAVVEWYQFLPKSIPSDFGQKPWTIVRHFD